MEKGDVFRQLSVIHAEIQAAERQYASCSRARAEVSAELKCFRTELAEGHAAIWECRDKLTNSQNESKEFIHELQQELKDRQAKEDQLLVQVGRLRQQSQELMGSVVEMDLLPKIIALNKKKSEIQNQLLLNSRNHNNGIISGM
jgi:hypothetical protein